MRNLTCCFFLLAMVLSGCEKRAADRISGLPDAPVSESTVNLSEVLILEKHLRDTLTAGHTQAALRISTMICEALDSARVSGRAAVPAAPLLAFEPEYEYPLQSGASGQSSRTWSILFALFLLLAFLLIKKRTSDGSPAGTGPDADPAAALQGLPEDHLTARQRLFARISELMREQTPYTDSALKREDLARMLGTNYNNVADAIRECTDGQTLSEYLDSLRLGHAARLLAKLDEPVGLISEMSGFQSRAHFYTLFRDKYQMTPKEYREAARRDDTV